MSIFKIRFADQNDTAVVQIDFTGLSVTDKTRPRLLCIGADEE